jgi:hypothetical protein
MIFKNIFAEKFSEKIGVFDSKQSQNFKNIDHNIGFLRKTPNFCRKLAKIAKIVIITSTPVVAGMENLLRQLHTYLFFSVGNM